MEFSFQSTLVLHRFCCCRLLEPNVKLGKQVFFRIILGYSEFYWCFMSFYWVLPSFMEKVLGFTGLYWILLCFKRV